jgi:hypothetical protein
MIHQFAVCLALLIRFGLAQVTADETILGVYIFHRHGDRTAKINPPANLTDLGYQEVFTSGQYYRSRYIEQNAPRIIQGMSSDIVAVSQIAASAPADTVLQNSATGFLQGLYPPVGQSSGLATSTLRNGTQITTPLQGYQLIPVSLASSGTSSEDNTWLQSATGCGNAIISSNSYFSSSDYASLFNETFSFYQGISPVVNGSFPLNSTTFKNAYSSKLPRCPSGTCENDGADTSIVFDLVNVAEIHNITINSSELLTNDVLFQLRTLADNHEWGLAYNHSDAIRAISGMTLAAQIVQFLNATSNSPKAPKLGIQFGAYGTFASFFGLADLPSANPDFYGIADYASTMIFELFTNTTASDNTYVRFLFHNGTTSNASVPVTYPLFGSGQDALTWSDFADGMNGFAIGSTEQWCTACGNTTGVCASSQPSGSSSNAASGTHAGSTGNGLSPAVNGLIGACVTLAVILGAMGLLTLLCGYRFVKRRSLTHDSAGASDTNSTPMELKAHL